MAWGVAIGVGAVVFRELVRPREQSALLMGLPVRSTVVGVYTLSGFCSALGFCSVPGFWSAPGFCSAPGF